MALEPSKVWILSFKNQFPVATSSRFNCNHSFLITHFTALLKCQTSHAINYFKRNLSGHIFTTQLMRMSLCVADDITKSWRAWRLTHELIHFLSTILHTLFTNLKRFDIFTAHKFLIHVGYQQRRRRNNKCVMNIQWKIRNKNKFE